MTAVMYRDAAAATELLELGWWVDRPDSNGVTPLMAAAWNGDAAMTELLLKGGADPNRRGPGGSVLDYAGRSGDVQVIELLKRSGALQSRSSYLSLSVGVLTMRDLRLAVFLAGRHSKLERH
jgi:ankyrin repeat protein